MKNIFVTGLQPGDPVDGTFILSEKTLAHKRDGGAYLTAFLSDKTGRVRAVAWDDAEVIAGAVKTGTVVRVTGRSAEYKGSLQVVISAMESVDESDVDMGDFLPSTRRDCDQMFGRLTAMTDRLSSGHLRELMDRFWSDESFVKKFKAAPAAKLMHHAYLGGLLEHSLSLTLLADRVAGHYGGINRDLLLCGAMLHDIGKIHEFDYHSRIDYSDEGRLISHIVIGVRMIEEKIAQLPDFPKQTALMLRHMIISHHGTKEFGSPEPPKILEAVLLNYLDEIDSKINGIRAFMDTQDPDSTWTEYHRPLGRHFYRGKAE
ncbi:MAG: HD domain-containing protein [Deltaproteobacteria bacterium]|nr:HD domain-containing protein [Deltaproteobacteria bacterium]